MSDLITKADLAEFEKRMIDKLVAIGKEILLVGMKQFVRQETEPRLEVKLHDKLTSYVEQRLDQAVDHKLLDGHQRLASTLKQVVEELTKRAQA